MAVWYARSFYPFVIPPVLTMLLGGQFIKEKKMIIINIEIVKMFIWVFFVTCWVWSFGAIIKGFGSEKLAIVIQGISAIFLLGEGLISLPIVHWLIFKYWR